MSESSYTLPFGVEYGAYHEAKARLDEADEADFPTSVDPVRQYLLEIGKLPLT